MAHFEKTINSKEIFDGKVIRVCHDDVLLENGKTTKREVVYHHGGVCIVPICDNGDLIFVKQFRYPYKKELLELPAGKLNKGEKPFETGVRELKEETGATAEKYTFLGELYPSPGYTDEIITIYMAEGLDFGEQNLDDDEFLDLIKIPLEKAKEMVLNNEIQDAKTQTAILKTYMLRK